MKCRRGGSRRAPTPGTPCQASCASVWPPRLEPPVPSRTISVARSAKPPGLVPDRVQVVVLAGQPQQRQAAVGMARAQPVERGLGARKRRIQGLGANAVRPDVLFEGAVDGLDDSHGR